jgi:hypothetical protein
MVISIIYRNVSKTWEWNITYNGELDLVCTITYESAQAAWKDAYAHAEMRYGVLMD